MTSLNRSRENFRYFDIRTCHVGLNLDGTALCHVYFSPWEFPPIVFRNLGIFNHLFLNNGNLHLIINLTISVRNSKLYVIHARLIASESVIVIVPNHLILDSPYITTRFVQIIDIGYQLNSFTCLDGKTPRRHYPGNLW